MNSAAATNPHLNWAQRRSFSQNPTSEHKRLLMGSEQLLQILYYSVWREVQYILYQASIEHVWGFFFLFWFNWLTFMAKIRWEKISSYQLRGLHQTVDNQNLKGEGGLNVRCTLFFDTVIAQGRRDLTAGRIQAMHRTNLIYFLPPRLPMGNTT